jgi:hypothetical protein
MKIIDAETKKLMAALIDGYTVNPCDNSVFHAHAVDSFGIIPAVRTKLRRDSTQASMFTPPSLLITSGLLYAHARDMLISRVRLEIDQHLRKIYDNIKCLESDGRDYTVLHLLVHNAHTIYASSVPHYVRMADEEGVTIPLQPASKALAFEVSMLVYTAQDPDDFEIVDADRIGKPEQN